MAILTIGGTAVKDPKDLTVSILDISNAERNANGTMMIDRVTTKRKLTLEWPALTNAEISVLLTAVSAVFFNVAYPDPMTGTVTTKAFYVGDRTSPIYSDLSGVVLWDGLRMDFVEQ